MHRRHLLSASIALALSPMSQAQQFPSKPVTVLVPFPAGGLADVLMRALAKAAERGLGQSIVIENKAGALGLLAANALVRAQPDGYTLMLATQNIYRAPFLGKVQYNPLEFSYILSIADSDHGLFVSNTSPSKNLKDVVASAQGAQGTLNVGTAGIGSTGHLLLQDLSIRAGASFNHAPYKGAPELGTALIGGTLDAAFMPVSEGRKLGSKLRLVAVFADQRLQDEPQVPTAKEQGYDSSARSTFALCGPQNMDPRAVAAVHASFSAALHDPAYQSTAKALGLKPWSLPPEQFKDWVKNAMETEKRLVSQAGLTVEN
ncbi:tripartite tricarboxylate transporter substrate binding protein [Variovorax sp. J31P179]|uniref:Bug family tripartite tricarboxylate transporter substrate binding protein n=1 Tax=Variovorax sp. J31P179 TaxID=3053508 RepID=UPI0025763B8C|nr:tripartite tricarboxylate transporter substrate binding protein [Variovorax sp. J31P179]MDM0084726.1 tripartite tricarboxylate transporter substrate binding protein [Variovorax sp. J31P179]